MPNWHLVCIENSVRVSVSICTSRRCRACGKPVGALRSWLSRSNFCSDAHAREYREYMSRIGLERLSGEPANGDTACDEDEPPSGEVACSSAM